jgi:putative Mg2+ transporter-C (MgtC) family protein
MHNHLGWDEIALRIGCALVGASIIGVNRGEHGHPAGLRTSLLVCLAACISMLQANILLPVAGKASDSYVVMDLMRLPLGILSGMGFIGAGAIVRRENMVVGVTTAATLWFLTVVGLCFGGGQLVLGMVGCLLGFAILRLLKAVEQHWQEDRRATLSVATSLTGPSQQEIATAIQRAGFRISAASLNIEPATASQEFKCQVHWRCPHHDFQPPPLVNELAARPGALKVAWQPQ